MISTTNLWVRSSGLNAKPWNDRSPASANAVRKPCAPACVILSVGIRVSRSPHPLSKCGHDAIEGYVGIKRQIAPSRLETTFRPVEIRYRKRRIERERQELVTEQRPGHAAEPALQSIRPDHA